jgi:hypothetical protein
VLFDRLIRRRGWIIESYQRWLAASMARLLVADRYATPTAAERNRT